MPKTAEPPAALRAPVDASHLPPRTPWLLEERRWMLVRGALDASLLLLAVMAARAGAPAAGVSDEGLPFAWVFPPVALALLALRGAYKRRLGLDVGASVLRVIAVTSLTAISIVALAAVVDPDARTGPLVARTWAFAALYLSAGCILVTFFERRARKTGATSKPTLLVGAGEVGAQVERRLAENPALGLRVVGYVDADPVPRSRVPDRRALVLGSPDDFVAIAQRTGAQHVVLTFTSSPDHVLVPLVQACEAHGIEVSLVPRMFESVNLRLRLESLGALPLCRLDWVDPKGWQFAVKHGYDRVLSALLLTLLAPPMLAIAAAIRATSAGPVLFRQPRVGRDGKRFDMLKFRSMTSIADEEAYDPELRDGLAPGGVEGRDRRTPVGRFLRRWSLDELPQLINVVRGDMSLVGPRPERPEYVELFDHQVRRYSDRHRVKSGITGLAQVSGLRGQTRLVDRVELDNHYIQNWSMALDLRILARTFASILSPTE